MVSVGKSIFRLVMTKQSRVSGEAEQLLKLPSSTPKKFAEFFQMFRVGRTDDYSQRPDEGRRRVRELLRLYLLCACAMVVSRTGAGRESCGTACQTARDLGHSASVQPKRSFRIRVAETGSGGQIVHHCPNLGGIASNLFSLTLEPPRSSIELSNGRGDHD